MCPDQYVIPKETNFFAIKATYIHQQITKQTTKFTTNFFYSFIKFTIISVCLLMSSKLTYGFNLDIIKETNILTQKQ